MDEKRDGPDTSSIQPISSLRSRFEDLSKSNGGSSNVPTVAPRSASGKRTAEGSNDRVRLADAKSTWRKVAADRADDIGEPKNARPQSTTPSTASLRVQLPTVTVDAPQSPSKTPSIGQKRAGNSIDLSIDSHTNCPSRPRSHRPTVSVASNSTARAADSSDGIRSTTISHDPPIVAKGRAGVVPPPVNRAAKPEVPLKLTASVQPQQRLFAPETSADLSDQSFSPFSTPPSSGKTSPDEIHEPEWTRSRNRSDASFVERLNSDAGGSTSRSVPKTDRSEPGAPTTGSASVEPGTIRHTVPSDSVLAFDMHEPLEQKARDPRFGARQEVSFSNKDEAQDRPRLPTRPGTQIRSNRANALQTRSLRTSPTRPKQLGAPRSVDGLERLVRRDSPTSATASEHGCSETRLPFTKDSAQSSTKSLAPAVPPPRRSMDRRPELPLRSIEAAPSNPPAGPSSPVTMIDNATISQLEYPDSSQVNRRPPRYKKRPNRIATEYDTRLLAVSGELVCTTGFITKAWNWRTGELVLNMVHGEGVKITAMAFKPATNGEGDSTCVWLGTNTGDIHEVNILNQRISKTRIGVHPRREVVRIIRFAAELWTLDEAGELVVWRPDHTGMASLDSPSRAFRVCRGQAITVACGPELWIATGKEIRIVRPGARSDAELYVLREPIVQSNLGEVTSGTSLGSQPDCVYFGHSDGKISIYSRNTHSCTGIIAVNAYRVSSLLGVGDQLWAGFSTGMIYSYDPSSSPWVVKKEWKGHDKPISAMALDPTALWRVDLLQVVTLGIDNMLCLWDGTVQDDWMDARMHEQDSQYCTFGDLSLALLTWNAGAAKPSYLQHSIDDSGFFQDYTRSFGQAPDVFVFGFQELVDLEDKKVTAKSFFKSKRRDPTEQEHMSHQYRVWRDHLTRCLEDYMPQSEPYVLLYTASLVGLFTCIFVKSSLRNRIQLVHGTEVKRGMGGLHGNKGALIVRLVVDDSSLCLVNCHLAAGQTQTLHRNNDIAAILESESLPRYPLDGNREAHHTDVFISGGDGSMVLDHEICVLSGDLNYRIDTMGRDTVVKHIQANNLGRLLERDQLLLSRKKNPGFRLRAFQENQITFAPTYKYNVRSDEYDTSEKRRSPAWCDRILYRGPGKVQLRNYRRWEVRVSDHRPVSAHLTIRVKKVDAVQQARIWDATHRAFDAQRRTVARAVQLAYLIDTLGLSKQEANSALKSRD